MKRAYLITVYNMCGDCVARRISMTEGDAENWIDSYAAKHGGVAQPVRACSYDIHGQEDFTAEYTAIAIV